MCLYITTSKGLYNYNIKAKKLTKVISNWHKGIFNKPSKGFFGICADNDKKQIITASRENISKNLTYNKSTDLILHFYNPINKISLQLGDPYSLCRMMKKDVIFDFRSNDLKNGGQGAPLAWIGDAPRDPADVRISILDDERKS